ncbi:MULTISPECIES: TrkA C-terminal domain-containing protein [unclassified Halobacteriovorax]|uniref:TrkA C-terminal domain-containing protein n=1 Tax=unclassified Halobacteriovorax TaxID=2639665 RepID=UPI000CD1DADC|nr:TrkA C-terminal domain-containing protein [Halobacteriovorax sp. DA5]POB13534.1 potassium transporter TrkA [Halobacteriovorax sp. DA5]
MLALLTLTIILFTSITIVKVATKILVLTGLSDEVARFQAKSALTGTGYTTSESESLVNHPLRRRVLSFLMTISNVGIISVISTAILSFVNIDTTVEGLSRFAVAITLFSIIIYITQSNFFNKWLNKKLKVYLGKLSNVELVDYANLLHLGDSFGIGEVYVSDNHWFANKTVRELSLPREGLIVLGVQVANGEYLGLPSKDYVITTGDTAILYGRADMLSEISTRTVDIGDTERKEAIEKLAEIRKEEKVREEEIVETREAS